MIAMNQLFLRKFFFFVGLMFVSIGLIANEWILARTFSSDGILEPDTRIAIWVFDIAFVLIGWFVIKVGKLYSSDERTKRRFFHAYPVTAALLVGVFLSAVMVLCAEATFYGLNRFRSKPKNVFEGSWVKKDAGDDHRAVGYKTLPKIKGSVIKDDLVGYKPPANAAITDVKRNGGKVIYKAVYSTDQYHRRVTPVENPEARKKFFVFFGCSITFGQGVNDSETMPFYVSQYASQYRPYNYGVIGHGPQSMLAKLQGGSLPEEISEKNGLAVYSFLEDHISRVIGVMHKVSSWGAPSPYYRLDNSGKLTRYRDFTSARPVVSLLYRILGRSQIVKYFNIDLPPRITDDHLEVTAKIIEESRNLFKAQFPKAEFYVLFYPVYWGKKGYVEELIPYLERAGIKYLDYSKMEWPVEKYTITGDAHPTSKGHKAVSARLAKDLEILDRNTH